MPSTPIKALSTTFICETCQQVAVDTVKAQAHTIESVCFQYCATARRGLTLFSQWDRTLAIRSTPLTSTSDTRQVPLWQPFVHRRRQQKVDISLNQPEIAHL